jgi:hypothetical protein
MNFKQHFTESTDISKQCEIEDITSDAMWTREIIKTWKLTRHFNEWREVTYFITLDEEGEYDVYDEDGNDILPDRFDKQGYIDAIKKWEIVHNLTPSTKQTFGDLIDEL